MSIWTIFYNIYAIPGNLSELVSALILSFSFEKRGLAARSDKNVEFTVVLIKIIKYEDATKFTCVNVYCNIVTSMMHQFTKEIFLKNNSVNEFVI